MKTANVISNSLAGVLIGVMNITVAISVAALMFSATAPQYLSHGIVVLLLGTLVVGLGGTLFSGFGGVICAPRSGLAPVFAAIVSAIYLQLGSEQPEQVLPSILLAIMLTSMVTGVFLLLLGKLRLGNLVRYIPYPVMGGFFAGIGYIFVKGGLTVAMGQTPSLAALASNDVIPLALAALLFAMGLYMALAKLRHWSTFPLMLLLGFVVFYLSLSVAGFSIDNAMQAGWLPVIESSEGLLLPLVSLSDFAQVNWAVVFAQSGGMLIAALLSAIILLLDVSGIEIITRHDLKPDRELKVMGMTNIISGIVAGYPGVHVASDTAFTYKLGGKQRLMGFVYAAVILLTILAGTDFISRVPTFILGGLLIYVGLDFLIDWLWKTRRNLPLSDYFIVLLILAVIVFVDILEGVAFGFIVAIIIFVINYSRLPVIKREATGREVASNIDRDLETRELLNQQGSRLRIMSLQGYIFFGTSDRLTTEIKLRFEVEDDLRPQYLVLDFHYVSKLDTSAIQAFSRLAQLSERYHCHILLSGMDDDMIARLQGIDFFTPASDDLQRRFFKQLDDAVAWYEQQVLTNLGMTAISNGLDIVTVLMRFVKNEATANVLCGYFSCEQYEKGAYLLHEGEAGESLHVITKGMVSVVIHHEGEEQVIRHYTTGAVIGEMALYTGEPRSASVRADSDTTIYRLDIKRFRDLQAENPDAASRFHAYIVSLLSERVRRANLEIQRYI